MWRNDFKKYLQSYGNHNSVEMVLTQTYRPMKQNRHNRNKPHLYGQVICNKGAKTTQ
jgi:hypothetical protein